MSYAIVEAADSIEAVELISRVMAAAASGASRRKGESLIVEGLCERVK